MTQNISTKFALAICLFSTAVISAWVFRDFLLFRKLYVFLDVGSDSLAIGLPHILSISNFLKSGTFPFWSHGIGIGQSTLALNHTLFDPFNLILFFCPQETIPFLIGYVVWIKTLAAATVFFLLCKKIGLTNYAAILGGMIYGLNGYLILWGQHYVFGLATIYFPLLLLGVELWLRHRKLTVFLVTVFFAGIWSYYFLFMMTIFLVPYFLFRILTNRTPEHSYFKPIAEFIGIYSLGIGLASFIFIPSFFVALEGPRVGAQWANIQLFATPEYYLSLLSRFFSNHMKIGTHYFFEWWNMYELPNVYCSSLGLLLVPISIFAYRRQKNQLLASTALLTLGTFLFPAFGLFANAFSYVSYRWTFTTIPLILLFSMWGFDQILQSQVTFKKAVLVAFGGTSILLALTVAISPWILQWSNISVLDQITTALPFILLIALYALLLILISLKKHERFWKIILLLVVATELGIHASVDVNERVLLGPDAPKNKKGIFDSSKEAVQALKASNSDFFRVNKTAEQVSFNDPISQDYYGTTSYAPLNSRGTLDMLNLMDVYSPNYNYIKIPPDRGLLNSFLGVRYHIVDNLNNALDGYEHIKTVSNLSVYENAQYLPLGIVLNEYVNYADFKQLPAYEKDRIILKAVVLKEDSRFKNQISQAKISPLAVAQTSTAIFELPAQFEHMDLKSNSFPSSLEFETQYYDPFIVLKTATPISGLLNISFQLESSKDVTGQIYWRKGDGVFQIDRASYFVATQGAKTYNLNLGYVGSIDRLRIELSNRPGKFKLDNFQVKMTPVSFLADSKTDIDRLKNQSLKMSSWSDSRFEGTLELSQSGVLVMQIPSAKGWKAVLDQKQTNIETVDGGLIGILVPAGKHIVSISYTPPFLLIGSLISLICLIITLLLFFNKRLLFTIATTEPQNP